MIKLSSRTQNRIEKIVEVGKRFGLDVFIIDKKGIRAKCDESYVFLASKEDMSWLEVDSICINKIDQLNSRLRFIQNMTDNYSLSISETKELDSGEIIALKLQLNGPKTGMEIGCASPSRHKLPWEVSDEKFISFEMDEEDANVVNGFSRTVQNKNRTLNIKGVNSNVLLSATDNEGDKAIHVISTSPTFHDGPRDFSYVYKANDIAALLKSSKSMEITLTNRGFMLSDINGITSIIFPEGIGQ
jgi:hypothetical protein